MLRRVITYLVLVMGIALMSQAKSASTVANYHGIDVSWYQKKIDWNTTARDKGVTFVYVKATEGGKLQDGNYRYNLENARKHGIKVGSYHFLRPETPVKQQFDNFKARVKKHEQDLIPVIDIEDVPELGVYWKPQQARDYLSDFAELVQKHYGCRPMIYTSNKFFVDYLGRAFADYPLFIARYGSAEPAPQNGAKWVLWQFTRSGRVDGIDHVVDLSRFNKGCGLHSIAFHKGGGNKRKAEKADKGHGRKKADKAGKKHHKKEAAGKDMKKHKAAKKHKDEKARHKATAAKKKPQKETKSKSKPRHGKRGKK